MEETVRHCTPCMQGCTGMPKYIQPWTLDYVGLPFYEEKCPLSQEQKIHFYTKSDEKSKCLNL